MNVSFYKSLKNDAMKWIEPGGEAYYILCKTLQPVSESKVEIDTGPYPKDLGYFHASNHN